MQRYWNPFSCILMFGKVENSWNDDICMIQSTRTKRKCKTIWRSFPSIVNSNTQQSVVNWWMRNSGIMTPRMLLLIGAPRKENKMEILKTHKVDCTLPRNADKSNTVCLNSRTHCLRPMARELIIGNKQERTGNTTLQTKQCNNCIKH